MNNKEINLTKEEIELIKRVIRCGATSSGTGGPFKTSSSETIYLKGNLFDNIADIFSDLVLKQRLLRDSGGEIPEYLYLFTKKALADAISYLDTELETVTSYTRKEVEEVLSKF